jgi:hypothetical protein
MGNKQHITHILLFLLAAGGVSSGALTCLSQVRVLVDQVGYETLAQKQAIVEGSGEDHPQKFALIDADSGKTVY